MSNAAGEPAPLKRIRDDVYEEAERQYYRYICYLNRDNKNWLKSKPTLEQHTAQLSFDNISSLTHFHQWLTREKMQEIAESLGHKSYYMEF